MATKKKRKGQKNPEITKLNIGVIFALFLLTFFGIHIFLYFTKTHLSIYEVQAVSLAQNDQAEAVIIREESMIRTDQAGYVNFYKKSGTRVKKNETIYSIDENHSLYDLIGDNGNKTYSLSESDMKSIKQSISQFHDHYDGGDYDEVYNLSEQLTAKIKTISDSFLLEHLNEILEQSGGNSSMQVFRTPAAGIVSYFSDSLDGITVNDVRPDTFDKQTYQVEHLFGTEMKAKDSLVYKLLTNENWTLMIQLTEEQYNQISGYSRLRFCINKDRLWVVQGVTFMKIEGSYFARVDMNKYLVRYLEDRFLDITIDMQSQQGLKIPNSAIVEKDFYMIPLSFFTKGGNSDKDNTLVVPVFNENKGEVEYQTVNVEYYYQDDKYRYISMNELKYGSFIYDPVTKSQFQVSLVGQLEGVYCVNKGYAQFRRIEHLYDGDEYSIVRMGVELSISEHDHIALDASKIDDTQIIY